ncbi:unnamed protein product [Calicophoron daubneyi]|uniref:Uncharacterized protein n=1 Tax=Calicophoron daubneyi TaxID=300641 RepID=A0AAV2TCK5_CALDB
MYPIMTEQATDPNSQPESARAPVAESSMNRLVEKIQLLTKSIFENIYMGKKCLEFSGAHDPQHKLFTQTRSITAIILKLRYLLHSTQVALKCLARYQGVIEKIIADIRKDIKLSSYSGELRGLILHAQPKDDVREILKAETNLLKHLKFSFEVHFGRLNTVREELRSSQDKLMTLINDHSKMHSYLSKKYRNPSDTSTSWKSEQDRVLQLNQSYPTIWSPHSLLKTVEEACSRAAVLRLDLNSMLTRIPDYVQATRNSLYYALTGDAAKMTRKQRILFLTALQHKRAKNRCLRVGCKILADSVKSQPDSVPLKTVNTKMQLLEETGRQLTVQSDNLSRIVQADIRVMQMRQREFTNRLVPNMEHRGFATTRHPALTLRRSHTICT